MNANTMVALALLAMGAAQAHASCYGLWQAQCFEVHNARSRDITHHILLTDGPVRLNNNDAGCDSGDPLLKPTTREALRTAFNERMRAIDGCEPVDELDQRTAGTAQPLVERFQRLKEPHERKKVHILEPPETDS